MSPTPYHPVSYLEEIARRHPRLVAVEDADDALTFAELLQQARRFGAVLGAEGLGPGEVVGVHLPNVWEYVALEIAIPELGGVIMPLPLSLGARELKAALARAGVRILVGPHSEHSSRALREAGDLGQELKTLPLDELLSRSSSESPPANVAADPDRVVEIALTSGTTGLPKLASLTAELKQVTFESFTSRLQVAAGDRVVPMSPLTQGIGGMCLYCIRVGATLVLTGSAHFSPEDTLRLAERARGTYLVGVPTNVVRMLGSPVLADVDLSSLKVTAVAGAPMPPEVAQRWEAMTGSRVCIFYGSMDAGQLAVGSPADPAEKRWRTVGRIHDRAECLISGPDGQALPAGEVGEICMRGPLVQKRYWGEVDGPIEGDGWAHLGDLGWIDDEGYLHVAGRLKDIIIRGGSNINPYEVEAVLRQHAAVRDACVVGRPDPDLGERAVAFVVLEPGASLSFEDVQGFLLERGLARYKWPELLEVIDELPLSGPGKLNRRALKDRAGAIGHT